jgi:hypothetical protein
VVSTAVEIKGNAEMGCAMCPSQIEIPGSLKAIPELDFTSDISQDPLKQEWLVLGALSGKRFTTEQGVEEIVESQSLLIKLNDFAKIYDRLKSIGDSLHGLGESSAWIRETGRKKQYGYSPFYEFDLHGIRAEPLVFHTPHAATRDLFVNPDLVFCLELTPLNQLQDLWVDPRRATHVLRRATRGKDERLVVEIRTKYLLRYLKTRQKALLIGHYRHLHLYNPPQRSVSIFVEGNLEIGSVSVGVKALLQNWGLRRDVPLSPPFLQRRLHLWRKIDAPRLDMSNPWDETIPFDVTQFTLPTAEGDVAPGRWKSFPGWEKARFAGTRCNFMDRIYFQADVLQKYEGTPNFSVLDDGSVICGGWWSLQRSTYRIGNALVSTAIGDFAEGVPFEEWPHWKQHSVAPPDDQALQRYLQESPLPGIINRLLDSLEELNGVAIYCEGHFSALRHGPVWAGDGQDEAIHRLKSAYPDSARDEELLLRATHLSTVVDGGLHAEALRQILGMFGSGLQLKDPQKSKSNTLGSLKLLERWALIATIVHQLSLSKFGKLKSLVIGAESPARPPKLGEDLWNELSAMRRTIAAEMAPLFCLNDIRNSGGTAHPLSSKKISKALNGFGLPPSGFTRLSFLALVKTVTETLALAQKRISNMVRG